MAYIRDCGYWYDCVTDEVFMVGEFTTHEMWLSDNLELVRPEIACVYTKCDPSELNIEDDFYLWCVHNLGFVRVCTIEEDGKLELVMDAKDIKDVLKTLRTFTKDITPVIDYLVFCMPDDNNDYVNVCIDGAEEVDRFMRSGVVKDSYRRMRQVAI